MGLKVTFTVVTVDEVYTFVSLAPGGSVVLEASMVAPASASDTWKVTCTHEEPHMDGEEPEVSTA
ncbi:hypothetical protein PLESTF_001927200 [Pleodorina starrii]|nr:hypothetical protein PLESTF_001927200 [Pleodorina starrii]